MFNNIKIVLILIVIVILGTGVWYFKNKEETTNTTKNDNTKNLTIGINFEYEPMEYIDSQGNGVGYDVDFAHELAKRLGYKAEIKRLTWEEIFEQGEKAQVDLVISSITVTPERSQKMLFSDPYFNAGQVMVVKVENKDITKPEDMKGKRVGVQQETTSEEEVYKIVSKDNVVLYRNENPSVVDLTSNKIDVIVIDYVAAIGMVKKDTSIKIAGDPFTDEFYGVGTSKNNQELIQKVNTTIRTLKNEGYFESLNKKWL